MIVFSFLCELVLLIKSVAHLMGEPLLDGSISQWMRLDRFVSERIKLLLMMMLMTSYTSLVSLMWLACILTHTYHRQRYVFPR